MQEGLDPNRLNLVNHQPVVLHLATNELACNHNQCLSTQVLHARNLDKIIQRHTVYKSWTYQLALSKSMNFESKNKALAVKKKK